MARGPKPHVVAFVSTLLLVAGTASVIDPPGGGDSAAITVAAVDSGQDVDANPDAPSPAATAPDGTVTVVESVEGEGSTAATDDGSAPTTAPGEPGPAPAPGASTPSTAPAPGASTAPPPRTTKPPSSSAPTYPEAALYDDKAKVRGISDTGITLCGHAALALGAAFDTSKEDLNVYWDMVNANGGVHGRSVTMTWEDDAYVSSQAITAAETCAGKSPFMILGGIGFDQIPGVRDWAEQNSELYLHHIAVAPTQTYNYSYSLSPTVEQVGAQFGHFIAKNHREATIGMIWRDTANWNPGSNAGREVLEAKGVEIAADHAIFQNQGVYTQQLNDMQLKGVDVVWVWENALNAAQILNQADEQGYFPTWVVFPFQTTLDILTSPQDQTIDGVGSWPAYAPGGYGGAFAEYDVDNEIARFEAAYAKFRPDTTPNDLLWQTWIGNKILNRMLTDCGKDCNRNRFAGMMLSGYQAHEKPGCKINFADKRSLGGHHGGFGFFSQRLFFPSTGPAYETTRYCASSLA